LERRRQLELRDEKVRQRIREESDEIKLLEQKLKTAYLNKDRSHQIDEKSVIDERKRIEDARLLAEMEALRKKQESLEEENKKIRESQKLNLLVPV
jgi:hypothetical protein